MKIYSNEIPKAKGLTLLLICCFLLKCGTKPDIQNIDRESKHWAALYCEARELRDRRFELADLIRYAEDTLKKMQNDQANIYSARLDSLRALVQPVTAKSALLADSITSLQQKLYASTLHSQKARKNLDQAFHKAIQEICPD